MILDKELLQDDRAYDVKERLLQVVTKYNVEGILVQDVRGMLRR